MRYRWKRITCAGVLVFALIIAVLPFLWVSEGKVIPGMKSGKSDIGGKTEKELNIFLNDELKKFEEKKIILIYKNIKEEIPVKDLQLKLNEETVKKILKTGRDGNAFENWYTRWKVLLSFEDAVSDYKFNKEVLNKKIEEIIQKYSKEPRDTLPVIHDDGTVTFDDGVPYLKIDKDKLTEKITFAIEHGNLDAIEIPVSEEKLPSLTKDQIKNITNVIGKYTTTFGGDYNRSRNIEIAANSINGTIIMPGESFSYNHATGSRSADNGYLSAPVIVGGKMVPGTGGGVCQVSSTLFNALLYSGLEVLERTSHFSPISYTPIGQDATVAEGYLDLKFKNNLKNAIYLYTEYSPGIISIYILGAKEDVPNHVEVFNNGVKTLPFEVVKKVDTSIKENIKTEYGHEGYRTSITQRATWNDGRVHEDTFASDYEPVNTVVYYASEALKNSDGKLDKNKDKINKNVKSEKSKEVEKKSDDTEKESTIDLKK